ncbi:hypothetical protein MKO06_08670 [Gramella sp. GC03-9]|uniref:Glycosyl transferase family 2 n=1 Tax=Christiangramia oceanisediminis TaxID=2920386 RepID=A0A9X2KW91_9FLAO|nr:hypothetical protein [Gramella oceanisediminis]MCP9199977.1 hypothetical protein [Gramella oceanisediminis]
MKKIQVGFLMSYDYELLRNSIPLVYEHSDSITIALDINFRTWTGERFTVQESFFNWLEEMDTKNKIQVYKDDFYDPNMDPMENEVRERKMLAERMGTRNWIIQIDSDEYFTDFEAFTLELRNRDKYLINPEKNKIQIAGYYVNLYKYTNDGILYVSGVRNQKFATNYPNYVTGRNTKERVIYVPVIVIHECLSRSEEEIKQKLSNWGHSHQIKADAFLEKWRKVDETNFKEFQNFFYLEPEKWKSLEFIKGRSLQQLSKKLSERKLEPSRFYLAKKNFGQWFKFLFK